MPVGLRPPWVKISQRFGSPGLRNFLGVDRDHDALVAEFFRRLLDEVAARHRRGVDRHLVGAGRQQRADVLDGAHAAADGERHEAGFRGAPHHIEHDAAVLVARGDVEEGELVGAGFVIGDGRFDRIAGVAQVDEIDAFDDSAVFDVEAGNDADLEHVTPSLSLCAAKPAPPPRRAGRHRARGRRWRLRVFARAARAAPRTSSSEARPPEAITGIDTASASAMVASRLRPLSMPSRATSV